MKLNADSLEDAVRDWTVDGTIGVMLDSDEGEIAMYFDFNQFTHYLAKSHSQCQYFNGYIAYWKSNDKNVH